MRGVSAALAKVARTNKGFFDLCEQFYYYYYYYGFLKLLTS